MHDRRIVDYNILVHIIYNIDFFFGESFSYDMKLRLFNTYFLISIQGSIID